MIELHQESADAIAAADLFQGLGTESRTALANVVQTVAFRPSEPLFPEGCGADALYVIREGIFHALEPDLPREPRVVRILGPGDVVDGVIELAGESRPVTVRSVGKGWRRSFPDRRWTGSWACTPTCAPLVSDCTVSSSSAGCRASSVRSMPSC